MIIKKLSKGGSKFCSQVLNKGLKVGVVCIVKLGKLLLGWFFELNEGGILLCGCKVCSVDVVVFGLVLGCKLLLIGKVIDDFYVVCEVEKYE